MYVPLMAFEKYFPPKVRAFIPTTSHEFLIPSEWNTVMSLLKVTSPLKIATRVLPGAHYLSLGYTFVVFHQIVGKLGNFLKSVAIASQASLASSLKSYVLKRKSLLERQNGILSYLSMSVDPRFKLAYIHNPIKKKQITKLSSDYISATYLSSLPCISMPDMKRKRAQDVSLHDYLLSAGTTEGPNKTLEEELTRWFSGPTVFLGENDDVFNWWLTKCTHFRRISLAAKESLAIPSGSVPSERAFSAAGRLVTPFRTSLSHDSIQAQICLSSWFEEIELFSKDMNQEVDDTDTSYDIVDHESD
jgi:hypothetical protein